MGNDSNEIWRRRHYSVGVFSWNELGPLVILHGDLNTEVYKDILTHTVYGRRPVR
jgi:hypothetical protein